MADTQAWAQKWERRKRVARDAETLPPETVAAREGLSVSTVHSWHRRWKAAGGGEAGDEALRPRIPKGRESLLSAEQLDSIPRLLEQPPSAYALADLGADWSLPLVVKLLEREFGIAYTEQGVWKILDRLGIRFQTPAALLATLSRARRKQRKSLTPA
jgi:transposase